jgi:hypothetical protein
MGGYRRSVNASLDYKLRSRDVNSDRAACAIGNASVDVIASLTLRTIC